MNAKPSLTDISTGSDESHPSPLHGRRGGASDSSSSFVDASNDYDEGRRKYARRSADNCISVIDGRAYPVYNWSDGGLLVQADDRMFGLYAPVEITMKFRLSGRLLDIPHRGQVVRKMRDRIAVQFEPLTPDVSKKFKQVVDDFIAREFVESQMV